MADASFAKMPSSSPQDVQDRPEKSSSVMIPIVDATTPALTSVMVCMAIMAVCAVAYFAIRCYFEEKRLRRSCPLACKCAHTTGTNDINGIECGAAAPPINNARQRSGTNTVIQTTELVESQSGPWADVRTSEAKRTVCVYGSPTSNNEAVPCWRPPATGSSRCYAGTQRTHRRRYRRRIPAASKGVPSITINSPSSSDSYSFLTTSRNLNSMSKSVTMNRDLTTITLSPSEGDDMDDIDDEEQEVLPHTSPYHPRYNTPVSENDEEHVTGDTSNQQNYLTDSLDEASAPCTRDVASQSTTAHLKLCQTRDVEVKFHDRDPRGAIIPQFEVLPGGKLVTRWTQTDKGVGSLISLDWDHFDSEHLRCARDEEEKSHDGDLHMGHVNTTLTASHTSATPTLYGPPCVSSPYVLCYECSDEFSLNDDRKVFLRASPRSHFCNSNSSVNSREPLDLRTTVTTPTLTPTANSIIYQSRRFLSKQSPR